MHNFFLPAAALSLSLLALSACIPSDQKTPAENSRVAKNIILFIGDGMGVSTVTAARIFDGQSQGMTGEEHWLAFERFPNTALVKTYNTNQQVPDSAGTATAIVSGHKTRAGVINIGPAAQRGDCASARANPLLSIGEIAKQHGVATGFVTTTRITHATPAALYARSAERDWEVDSSIPAADWALGCRDIAYQLVTAGLDVAMGGGSAVFVGSDLGGVRRNPADNLVKQWLAAAPQRSYISSATELQNVQAGTQVLGLFAPSHMTFIADLKQASTEPSLSQMTATAIDLMAQNQNGYFLMVEGGRIDHGHHIGKPGYALLETQEFNRAVTVALQKVDLEETLILVTADHSHVFTMGGYPTRGNPILGLVVGNDASGDPHSKPELAADGQTYTTLAYANGPGAVTELPRPAPATGINARAQALVPLAKKNTDGSVTDSETHGGEDVALYATGAGAARVHGVIEQNRIFNIMMDALGWQN